jgi:sarcosine oxidase gamma subunit
MVGDIGVHSWQVDAVPSYEFSIFRSFARSFWQGLIAASAEFGVEAGRQSG